MKDAAIILMRKFYFTECCLNVFDKYNLLNYEILSNFKNKSAYRFEIFLNISTEMLPLYNKIVNVYEDSRISINDINGEMWLFSNINIEEDNYCHIVTSRDCTDLKFYINYKANTNINTLKHNIMYLLRTAIECCLIHHDGVSIHASCIVYNGNAVLFTAPSGTGKSTQADIWNNLMNTKTLNGDRPFLHLFPTEVRAYGVPWDGKEQMFLQENYPISAIIEVRQARKNSVRKMNEEQSFKLMMNQCFIPMWDQTTSFYAVKTIKSMVKKVQFYRLFCLPENSSAELLHEILFLNRINLLNEEKPDMKIKDGFVLKNIVDEWVVMPTGANVKNYECAIVLNDVAAFIWKQLEKPTSREDLFQAILNEYDIDEETALADMEEILIKLKDIKLLQE